MTNVKELRKVDETFESYFSWPENFKKHENLLQNIVLYVLTKNSLRRKRRFLDESVDLLSMCFLDDSDRDEDVDLGFLEDRIMLANDFLSTTKQFQTSMMVDKGNNLEYAQKVTQKSSV